MKRAIIAIAAVVAGGWVCVCQGRTITVDDDGPADFPTIQAAIDDSNDGDTVLVADGTYTGDGNRDIDFHGKAITVKSENGPEDCIIDCNGTEADRHRGFYFHSGEGRDSAVIGFAITNGYSPEEYLLPRPPYLGGYRGGGICCKESNPTISHCRITGNRADEGGGIYCQESAPRVSHCTIAGNYARELGGGMNIYMSDAEIANCIVWDNSAPGGPQIYYSWPGSLTVAYSDVQGGRLGVGNIDADPCFAEAGYWDTNGTPEDAIDDFWVGGDYHLKSQGGRWDANEGGWTTDEVTSPCIDAGDPMSPIGLEPFGNGGRVNMGAYGGTAEASKSYFGEPVCETIVAGDINGDCAIDFLDFRIMALHWLGGLGSNYRVEDGIEYHIETDKSVYHLGEDVQMLYRVTNLTNEDVELYFPHSPEWNFWVKKDGEVIWAMTTGWYTMMTWLELGPGEDEEYLYVWDMEDNEGALVTPGEYDAVAGFDAGTDGLGWYDFSKVSVTIEIEP